MFNYSVILYVNPVRIPLAYIFTFKAMPNEF